MYTKVKQLHHHPAIKKTMQDNQPSSLSEGKLHSYAEQPKFVLQGALTSIKIPSLGDLENMS